MKRPAPGRPSAADRESGVVDGCDDGELTVGLVTSDGTDDVEDAGNFLGHGREELGGRRALGHEAWRHVAARPAGPPTPERDPASRRSRSRSRRLGEVAEPFLGRGGGSIDAVPAQAIPRSLRQAMIRHAERRADAGVASSRRHRSRQARVVVDPRRAPRLEDLNGEARVVERPPGAYGEGRGVHGCDYRRGPVRLYTAPNETASTPRIGPPVCNRSEDLRHRRALCDESRDPLQGSLLMGAAERRVVRPVSIAASPSGALSTQVSLPERSLRPDARTIRALQDTRPLGRRDTMRSCTSRSPRRCLRSWRRSRDG
jgi:hypothetical protein